MIVSRGTAAGEGGNRPRFWIPVLLAFAVLRVWLGFLPGYPPDLNTFKVWALNAGMHGVHAVYDPMSKVQGPAVPGGTPWTFGNFDYPPLYAYLLAPLGAIYGWIDPGAMEHFRESSSLGFVVKIPPLLFDLLTAALIGLIAHRFGFWPGKRSWFGVGAGTAAALFYLVQPAVLFNSGYWGQPDVVYVFFILLSLTLILLDRTRTGWVTAALACLMKPLAMPYLPLLAFATVLRGGWRKLLIGGAWALATIVLAFLPFVIAGRTELVFQRLFSDLDLMPLTSVNAHNLWWLLGPWKASRDPWIGPITKTHAGLALFGLAYLAIFWGLWRAERRDLGSLFSGTHGSDAHRVDRGSLPENSERWVVAGAAIAFSFFFLSTHMHENHLFAVIPFLVLLAGRGKTWAALAVLVGLAVFVNMADHDLILNRILFPSEAPDAVIRTGVSPPMPRAVYSIATLNSIAMTVLYCFFARAAYRSFRQARG